MATSTTSCKTVSVNSTQRPNKEIETTKYKTLNNALVSTNEVLSTTWKSSKTMPPPHIHKAEIHQDSKNQFIPRIKIKRAAHQKDTMNTGLGIYIKQQPIDFWTISFP